MKNELQQATTYGLRMIRLPEVRHRVGLGRSTIYVLIKRGEFPAPVPIGPRAVAWVLDDITEWIEAHIAAARQPIAPGRKPL